MDVFVLNSLAFNGTNHLNHQRSKPISPPCVFYNGASRDAVGYYRITGRVDDVIIVSGHNLGTAPIEDAINEHQSVANPQL